MVKHMAKDNYSMPVFMLIVLFIGLLVALGASVALPNGAVSASFGAGDNGKTVSINEGSQLKISLDENPTTGYSWNVTVTPGLAIVDSQYSSSSHLTGAGGTREWTIKATGKGQQQFSAVYCRSWEPLTGNESKFVLTVSVI